MARGPVLMNVMFALVTLGFASDYAPLNRGGRCEPITVPLCRDMPYNVTRMPNMAGHETQEEASVLLHQFTPLIDSNCSAHLRFFLCSLFTPLCSEKVPTPIPSCQSLCHDVRDKCLPLLRSVAGIEWPPVLDCSVLPVQGVKGTGGLCMAYPRGSEAPPAEAQPATMPPKLDQRQLAERYPHVNWPGLLRGGHGGNTRTTQPLPADTCPPRYVRLHGSHAEASCQPRCDTEVLFTAADRQLTELWMTVWATLCFLSTLFTVLTFWIDTARFKYPERPIVFISMCYNIYSLGYLLRMFLGAEHVICDVTPDGEQYLISEGLDSAGCIVTFLLLYYFGMASSLWWVVLTFTWYLSAGRKWSPEAVQRYATHLHALAWGLPALLTTIIITAQTISGSELTGLCYVSARSVPLLGLVIGPLSVFLLLGALFLGLGHAALVRIRQCMSSEGTNTHKLETLIVRIGVYGLLYMIPAAGVVACYIYEYVSWDRWRAQAWSAASSLPSGCDPSGAADLAGGCPLERSIPPVTVFMLRLFMSLVVGVVSGTWVWTSKTGTSWQRFCSELCCRRRRRHGAKSVTYTPAPTSAGGGGGGARVGLPLAMQHAQPVTVDTRQHQRRSQSQHSTRTIGQVSCV